jgi:nucleoside-diphosphate-sugar epimerase
MDSVAVGFSSSARVVARKNLSIVVTGGAGFLGSHLSEHLVGQRHHVICIDNFHTGRPVNVRALAASGRFEVIDNDIVRPFEHKLAPEPEQPTTVNWRVEGVIGEPAIIKALKDLIDTAPREVDVQAVIAQNADRLGKMSAMKRGDIERHAEARIEALKGP